MVELSFDRVNNVITVASPDTEITVQELHSQIKEYSQLLYNIDLPTICDTEGGGQLSATTNVGFTLKLIDWTLSFEARGGSDYVTCTVSNGNLIAYDTGTSQYVSPITGTAYVTVSVAQDTSAALLNQGELTTLYRLMCNKMTIDQVNSKLQLWNDAGDTVLYEWDLTDKDGGTIALQGTGPTDRGVPTEL
jgi:hypothetical protein